MMFIEDRSTGKQRGATDDPSMSLLLRISNKGDDTQSVNTVKSSEDGLFVKRLRSLFPAIEIKVEHVR